MGLVFRGRTLNSPEEDPGLSSGCGHDLSGWRKSVKSCRGREAKWPPKKGLWSTMRTVLPASMVSSRPEPITIKSKLVGWTEEEIFGKSVENCREGGGDR